MSEDKSLKMDESIHRSMDKMQVTQYLEKEGKEKIEEHEKFLGKEILNYVMFYGGGSRYDFMYDYMRDDTDGRYYQVHYMVWHFSQLEETVWNKPNPNYEEDKKHIFDDLITFAKWAIECNVWAMDGHFKNSVTELLKIPQFSKYHKDIRQIWDNYIKIASKLGFTMDDMGHLRIDSVDYNFHGYYKKEIKNCYSSIAIAKIKAMDKDHKEAFEKDLDRYVSCVCEQVVEEELRKNTSYPKVEE